jgi:hypothetical protein
MIVSILTFCDVSIIQAALLCGFDFIVTPLVHPDYRPPSPGPAEGDTPGQLTPPFRRKEVLYLPSSARVSQVLVFRPFPVSIEFI